MFVPVKTSWIIPRQRRNADRDCCPESPGLFTFAAYFRLIPRTTTARTATNAARNRAGFPVYATRSWLRKLARAMGPDMRRVLAAG